jgi:hypothetical protein
MSRYLNWWCVTATMILIPGVASASTIIEDDFESDTSANYTVATQDPNNGSVTFEFDYVAAGIPLAPRSASGAAKGLRLTVNDFDGIQNTQTVFHNTVVNADVYQLTVDVYMAFVEGPSTTEHAHVGVGGDGATPNSLFNPISGTGSFMAFTGDGGSASDYRWFLATANGGLTTFPNDHPSYLGHGSNNTNEFYSNFFPSPPSTVVGVPGNIWTTVEVLVDNIQGRIQYFMTNSNGDRELFFDNSPDPGSPTPFSGLLEGLVSIGLHDAFTSIAPNTSFAVFDNLLVEEVAPSSGIQSAFAFHGGWTGQGSAIDAGKSMAREGSGPQELGLSNLINTSRGINGIVFNVLDLGDADNLSAADFEFQVSPQGAFNAGSNPPSGWEAAPAPSAVTVTPGAIDQVLIQWGNNQIENRWLRVTVLANANTGLAEPAVYYLGHFLGETTGAINGTFSVSFLDITPIRAEVGQTVDATSIADIDKNGLVSFQDITAMRGSIGSQLTAISIP